MNYDLLQQYYQKNKLPDNAFIEATKLLDDFYKEIANKDSQKNLDDISLDLLEEYIEKVYRTKQTSIEFFLIFMRYFKVTHKDDLYVLLTRYTGILDVLENIFKRYIGMFSKKELDELLEGLDIPSLGMSPKLIPNFTSEFMRRIESKHTIDEVKEVLTGNNHSLSEKNLLPEIVAYENAISLEAYLVDRHQRKIIELEEHMHQNLVWFEQIITTEVIEFVKANQEILSAVLLDDSLYITKIPYDTKAYLEEKSKTLQNYHACHCSFAKEAIFNDKTVISPYWCYCSAGFAKFPFEIILGQKLKITCLKTALNKDGICRFKIDLKGIEYKH